MTDYAKAISFLSRIMQDNQLSLDRFLELCQILNIPSNIEAYVRGLIFNQRDRFESLFIRNKILIYIAAFFVAYVVKEGDYDPFKQIINDLVEDFDNNPVYITKYVDLNKILSVIRQKGFHPYLITPSLAPEEIEAYTVNIYKIEMGKYWEKIDKELELSFYIRDFEVLLDPLIYIIRTCNEHFEKVRRSRYGAAIYFLLKRAKKFQRLGKIPMRPFFIASNLSDRTFFDHYKRILKYLDVDVFNDKFPDFELIIEKKLDENYLNNYLQRGE